MKIDESSVVLKGQHSLESEHKTEVSSRSSFQTIFADISEASEVSQVAAAERSNPGEKVRLMLQQLIAEIIALLSGKKSANGMDVRDLANGQSEPALPVVRARPLRVSEFAWESAKTETLREHERSEFSASGVIRTADGKAIDFELDLTMSRDFQSETKAADGGKVTLRDPLVINFSGASTELSEARFDFDLDSDGKAESIQGATGGSAFLVLDRNGDGRINDGSELFGASSGDGFADLAALDSDGNHWIDEADTAFASLKAWSRDAEGNDKLSTLKERGVGALYLGAIETPFSLKDSANHLRGQIRASGIYLREDGRPGSLQQIDLAV